MVNVPARTLYTAHVDIDDDDDDHDAAIFPSRNVDNFKYYVGIRIYTWILLNVIFAPHRLLVNLF